MEFEGTVFRYGRDIDTDVIIPARYLNTSDPAELAKHCLEDLDTTFVKRVKPGDIIVADENFGCGSSREHAPVAIKAAGVSVVIAKSFARIFYRNALNLGVPALVCADLEAARGDDLEVLPVEGRIINHSSGREFSCEKIPPQLMEIVAGGGLMPWLERKLAAERGQ